MKTARHANLRWLALLVLGAGLPTLPLRAEIFVRASQVGYRPSDPKIALAFAASPLPTAFAVVEADSGRATFQGKVRPLPGESWGQFAQHAELDFTKLTQPGRYRLRVGDNVWVEQIVPDLDYFHLGTAIVHMQP